MDPMVIIIGGGLVLLSILATLFFVKSRNAAALTVLQEQLKQKEMQFQEQLSFRASLQTERDQLLSNLSKKEAQLEMSQQALKQAQQNSESLSAQIKLEFAEIAHKVMQSNTEQLRVKKKKKIGELLKPLKTEL